MFAPAISMWNFPGEQYNYSHPSSYINRYAISQSLSLIQSGTITGISLIE